MRRYVRRLLLALSLPILPVTAVAVALPATPAFALCNGLLYNYAGEYSNLTSFVGIERYISVPASSLADPNNEHIAFWIGDNAYAPAGQSCPNSRNLCWVQAGHEQGLGGDGTVASHLEAYFETTSPAAVGGYWFQYHPEVSLPQNTFYTVFYNGLSYGGFPKFQAFVDGTFLGAGEMWTSTGYIEANAEMYNDGQGQYPNYCPTIDPTGYFQYFGTNGAGSPSASTELDNATTIEPNNWSAWTSSATRLNNYEMDYIWHNSAFQTTGGSQ